MVKGMAWVNVVLALLWAFVSLELLEVDLEGGRKAGTLGYLIASHAVVLYAVITTARALFKRGPLKVLEKAVKANHTLVALGFVSGGFGLRAGLPGELVIVALLMFLPAGLNLLTLRRLIAGIDNTEVSGHAFVPGEGAPSPGSAG